MPSRPDLCSGRSGAFFFFGGAGGGGRSPRRQGHVLMMMVMVMVLVLAMAFKVCDSSSGYDVSVAIRALLRRLGRQRLVPEVCKPTVTPGTATGLPQVIHKGSYELVQRLCKSFRGVSASRWELF